MGIYRGHPRVDLSVTRPQVKPACPECGSRQSRVLDTRESLAGDATWRRRQCLNTGCRHTYATTERVDPYARARYPTKKSAVS